MFLNPGDFGMRDYAADRDREFRAKVEAVNLANGWANDFHGRLTDVVVPFLGKQVAKASGGLLEKVKKVLPALPSGSYLHLTDYSLAWTFKSCVVVRHGDIGVAQYYETTVYVGDLTNGVLTKLHEVRTDRKTDYCADVIYAQRAKVASLKAAYESASGELYPFGEG